MKVFIYVIYSVIKQHFLFDCTLAGWRQPFPFKMRPKQLSTTNYKYSKKKKKKKCVRQAQKPQKVPPFSRFTA